ncbi:MAG: hypothetical protein HGA96_08995 [Desulfobulbaceae bacterium]|nr:hypothetical protein [Desulfobulbaceae bacterium]
MMPMMPIINQAAALMPSGTSGVEKSGPAFEEALRSESAALGRTSERGAGQETQAPRAERREAAVRTESRDKQEGEPAEQSARPDPIAAAAGETGEHEAVADGVAPQKGKSNGTKADALAQTVPVGQPPLPEWLLLTQVMMPPVAVVGAGVAAAAISPGTVSAPGTVELTSPLAPAAVVGGSELAAPQAPVAPVAVPQVPVAPVATAVNDLLGGALPPSGNPEARAAVVPESGVTKVVIPPALEVVETDQLRQAAVAKPAIPGETGENGNVTSQQVSRRPVAVPPGIAAPIGPEITSRAAGANPVPVSSPASPVELSQVASPILTSQSANPLPGRPAGHPVPVPPATTPASASPGAEAVALSQMVSQVAVSQTASLGESRQISSPVALEQVANPVAVSQAAGPTVMLSTLRAESPAPAPGENPPAVAGEAARPVGAGLAASVVATPLPADAAGEHREFADFTGTAADEIKKVARPADSGRAEFAALLTGSDQPAAGGTVRAALQSQATPAVTSTLVMDGRIVDQVVSRVNLSSASGETSLSMTLHPKELGEIRVELISGKDGVRAHLHSQTQMVQEALERHLPRLREAFEAQGVKLSELQVSCDGRRDGGNTAFQQREQGQASPFRYQVAAAGAGAAEQGEWPGGVGAPSSGWSSTPGFSLRV